MKYLDTILFGFCFAVGFILSAASMDIIGSVVFLALLIWTMLSVFDEAEYEYRWQQYYKADNPRSVSIS